MLAIRPFSICCTIMMAQILSACEKAQEVTGNETVVRPVKMLVVDTAGNVEVNRFPAVIGANRLSELGMQVGGKLVEFPIKESQELKRGDLIAKLDQRDFKSAVATAKAQFDNAESEYQRALRLLEEDAIARTVVEQRKAQFDVSKAQLEQAEKALEDSVLLAPFNGVVAETLVKKLQTVSAGQAVIQLMGLDLFKATIDLPASFIARIPKDETDTENRQAFVYLDAAPNQPIEAEFKEATLVADAASQTYAITFTFQPPANLNVLPGMNATVEVRRNSETAGTRVAVPIDAVTSDGDNNFVWLVDPNSMTVSRREVMLEQGVGSTVVITEGLAANDRIAAAGAAYLSEGMKVREWVKP